MFYLYVATVSAVLARIFYTDLKERYVYDLDIAVAAGLGILYSLYAGSVSVALLNCAVGAGVGLAIFGAAYLAYGFEAFGQGDVLTLGLLGLLLGDSFFPFFVMAICGTGVISIGLLCAGKGRDYGMPFASALIGWLPVYFACGSPDMWEILNLLS